MQPPHDEGDVSDASHPFEALPSQLSKPGLHAMPHEPLAHDGVALNPAVHVLVHVPQWAGSRAMSTSHPLVELPSQFANPLLHAPSTHAPCTQLAPALANAHASPHPPQFAVSFRVSRHAPPQQVPLAQACMPSHEATHRFDAHVFPGPHSAASRHRTHR